MNLNSFNNLLTLALQQFWTGIFSKIIAVALIYGSTVHIANILGVTVTPWLTTPLLWRIMDVLLLIFDLISAIALWQGYFWSVWLLFGAYSAYKYYLILCGDHAKHGAARSYFVLKPEDAEVLSGLLGTELLLLGVFAILIYRDRLRA